MAKETISLFYKQEGMMTNGDVKEIIFEVVRLKEIAETTVSLPHPYPRETVDWWINFVRESMNKGCAYEFGLFKKDNPNEYIGNCGFVGVSNEHNHGELGYFINPIHWNNGYGTEACARLVEFGFTTLGLERIHGRCMAKNKASKRVMEKCGLKVEGLAKHEVFKWGKYEDVYHLGLIRSEWKDFYLKEK
ncbi:GNAT family N-acetyltransferase [Bacillus alkalicellulosilyticus]|uniref:GNAT family N-acetyltransferase n=1 Tax=Alkalihalobacterium alkalicellulosilyticum TaxID=1912214 RepID=UPI0009962598|nr:GNAT family protein [Bacillus alkalicellulosilyticus]